MCCGNGHPQLTGYENDPRVVGKGDDMFLVTDSADRTWMVTHSDELGWCIFDESGQMVQVSDDGDPDRMTFGIGIKAAEYAIGALIGDPRPAQVAA